MQTVLYLSSLTSFTVSVSVYDGSSMNWSMGGFAESVLSRKHVPRIQMHPTMTMVLM